MKRLIRSATAVTSDIIDAILAEFGKNHPSDGCSFITKDGTFINIYPKIDTHEDLCWWIKDEFNIDLEYYDEEYFIREFGWVRLRVDPTMIIIELSSNRPTNAQWAALEEWLEYVEGSGQKRRLYLNVCDDYKDTDVEYAFGSEYFTEDIIKILKRYYTSGKLYASTQLKRRKQK